MHIHRSAPKRAFTVLPNQALQDRRLSYTARGLLVDLLSRPDGWREDGRRMADTSPQGRCAVAKTLRELARAGYYHVVKIRRPDGTFRTETHVYDTPTAAATGEPPNTPRPPAPAIPGPGESPTGRPVGQPEQNRKKGTTLPAASPELSHAARVLARIVGPEPRLPLGASESLALAPLVDEWLQGARSEGQLASALLCGLPARVHSPMAFLSNRLVRKRPVTPAEPPPPRWTECPTCGDPVALQGPCRSCAGLHPSPAPGSAASADATARGLTRVRAALRGPSRAAAA
jgi:hypothetical protein